MLEKHSDSKVHVEKIEQRPTASIAFGLERLGLIAVQAPIILRRCVISSPTCSSSKARAA